MEELVATKWEDTFIIAGCDLDTTLSSSILILNPLRHCGAAYQAEILGAASGAEMTDLQQMKIVPLITCEIPFSQHVCELVFGVHVTDLNFGVQINPVKQPIQRNSVGPWNMSHCGTSTFDNHFDYTLIVSKTFFVLDGMLSMFVRMTLVGFIGMGYACLTWRLLTGFPSLSLGSICVVRYGMKNFNHQIPESESGKTVHA